MPGRCRGGPEFPTPKSTGKSAKARTAAAMERNRRGARKFRERQSKRPLCPDRILCKILCVSVLMKKIPIASALEPSG